VKNGEHDLPPLALKRNPVQHPRIVDPEAAGDVRNLDCRAYNLCLSMAASGCWEGFTCASCQAYEPMAEEDSRRDLEGMAAMLYARTELLSRNEAPKPSPFVRIRRDAPTSGAGGADAGAEAETEEEAEAEAPEAEDQLD